MDRQEGRSRKRHRGQGRVTLADVARQAGVAPITVSRALNTPGRVSEAVKARVDAAVEALGYVPNLIAGGLAAAGTRVIPVIVPSLAILTFIEVIDAIQKRLEAAGYQMLLATTDWDLDREAGLVDTVLGYSPSGVILTGLRHHPRVITRLKEWGRPVVEIMEVGEDPIDMNVGVDGLALGRAMARHLLDKGYRRIVFAGSHLGHDYRAAQRLEGHQQALAEAGLSKGPVLEYAEPASYAVGARALADLLAMTPRPDAVACSNDILASGILLAASKQGIRIPDELAVGGYLGLPLAEHLSPPLTTLAVARSDMGRQAAELLLQRLEGMTPAEPVRDLGFTLVEGGST
ncbi:LacI family DNA-binding transcriptional regulator [Halomonas denitrificans]|uniref:LacI family DNA-binding transcriptional regulator n=1 Tax=Halomonas TaxID=2745 RepID=UPI001C97A234|nr:MULTISPECIES: LacI family DNA-binding transcriptional regulator [Halomonas]MBY5927326.1 LacI family DNA-binding transcriptional regulator [Halomonas sp. DP4Y7-2]MBY6234367.1 LacI family DNA-binding transcriptional regulator [Halomonas sp. DP4Y7-1]MCA0973784.1 LacI family DNA-binding transcriptional regulator [Halomonas denitrificans]